MNSQEVRLVHAMPGRVRLKVAKLEGKPGLAQEIQKHLATIQGIQHIRVNPVNGSVLVQYDAQALMSPDSVRALSEACATFFPEVNIAESSASLLTMLNQRNASVSTASSWTNTLLALDKRIRAAIGGIDLNVFVPMLLFLLGVRSLLVAKKIVLPAWYDLFWFSFGTYVALSPMSRDQQGE